MEKSFDDSMKLSINEYRNFDPCIICSLFYYPYNPSLGLEPEGPKGYQTQTVENKK